MRFVSISTVVAFTLAGLCSAAYGQQKALLLFGDREHKTFLGCLNCGQFDANSVCNKFGPFGSQFSATSIWNSFGRFGSSFSGESPWNQFTSSPPVIVDKDGGFYGYLTANQFHANRTRIEVLNQLADRAASGEDLGKVADEFCGN